jgi:hypothetical protein
LKYSFPFSSVGRIKTNAMAIAHFMYGKRIAEEYLTVLEKACNA